MRSACHLSAPVWAASSKAQRPGLAGNALPWPGGMENRPWRLMWPQRDARASSRLRGAERPCLSRGSAGGLVLAAVGDIKPGTGTGARLLSLSSFIFLGLFRPLILFKWRFLCFQTSVKQGGCQPALFPPCPRTKPRWLCGFYLLFHYYLLSVLNV